MSIVVDVNAFPSVFDPSNEDHAEFSPVKSWIERGEGFLLYGGTKFKAELLQSHRRVKLIRLMRDAGLAVEIDGAVVDQLEAEIKAKVSSDDCNDPHIIALLVAARCGLLCSQDKESYPFIKNRALYPRGAPRVRIYTGKRNANLLKRCKRNEIANAR